MSFTIKIKEKKFHNKHNNSEILVLKDIDVKIKANEFLCIVGPSGCGKTTLMNMIGGLVKSDGQMLKFKYLHVIISVILFCTSIKMIVF